LSDHHHRRKKEKRKNYETPATQKKKINTALPYDCFDLRWYFAQIRIIEQITRNLKDVGTIASIANDFERKRKPKQ
jgi:hypothetical protein